MGYSGSIEVVEGDLGGCQDLARKRVLTNEIRIVIVLRTDLQPRLQFSLTSSLFIVQKIKLIDGK